MEVTGGASSNLPIYVSKPALPTSKGIIVLPEVFGWAGRLKGICDTFAKEGYYVIMPDCFRGDTANGKSDFMAWITVATPWSNVKFDFEAIMKEFKAAGVTEIGAIGYCWGVS